MIESRYTNRLIQKCKKEPYTPIFPIQISSQMITFIGDFEILKRIDRSYAEMCKGGLDQNPPVFENFGKPPCPAKPDPPSIAARRAAKIFRFFREFSGKFRVF